MESKVKPEMKEKVKEKFDLASDIKEARIEPSMDDVKIVDGKFQTTFRISGLPAKTNKAGAEMSSWDDRNKRIPKIFDDWDDLSAYAKIFFSKTDDELIKLCQEK